MWWYGLHTSSQACCRQCCVHAPAPSLPSLLRCSSALLEARVPAVEIQTSSCIPLEEIRPAVCSCASVLVFAVLSREQMKDKAGSGQWSVFLFCSCQEHLLKPVNISPQKSWRNKEFVWIVISRASSLFLLHDWVCFYRKNLSCYESLWLKSRILLSDAFFLKRWCCSWYLSSLGRKKQIEKSSGSSFFSRNTWNFHSSLF